MDYQHLAIERHGPVTLVRFDRPDAANALSRTLMSEIIDCARGFHDDLETRAVVFTGNGRAFSAGLDAEVLASVTEAGTSGAASGGQRDPEALPGMFSYLLEVPKPVIAAVNGVAAGGGVGMYHQRRAQPYNHTNESPHHPPRYYQSVVSIGHCARRADNMRAVSFCVPKICVLALLVFWRYWSSDTTGLLTPLVF
jgi:hypothetical protein